MSSWQGIFELFFIWNASLRVVLMWYCCSLQNHLCIFAPQNMSSGGCIVLIAKNNQVSGCSQLWFKKGLQLTSAQYWYKCGCVVCVIPIQSVSANLCSCPVPLSRECLGKQMYLKCFHMLWYSLPFDHKFVSKYSIFQHRFQNLKWKIKLKLHPTWQPLYVIL